MKANRLWRATMAGGLGLLLVLTSCGGSEATSSDTTEVVEAVSSTVNPDDLAYTDDGMADHMTDDAMADHMTHDGMAADITDEGVLDAAIIILSDGDLEAALAEGRITEADVDNAIAALEAGTLDD